MPTVKPRHFAAIAAAIACLGALLLLDRGGNSDVPATIVEPALQPQATQNAAANRRAPAAAPLPLSPADADFIEQLRGKFAPVIANKHARIKAIEQVVAYLMEKYPADWRERMQAFLQLLFPDLADTLFDEFQKLMRHNDWLREHRDELTRMPAAERRAALWKARRDVFGADADEIWASAARNEQVQDALAALPGNAPLRERLDTFLGAVRAAYGEQAGRLIENRQTELLNRFLNVDSVQRDLAEMPPAQRSAALREIRSGMGMDEAALARWDQLDSARDQAWRTGGQYLQARAQVLGQYQGEAQARELHSLQDRLFGAEADTIRSEEAAGFSRFAHARRYGQE